MIIYQSCFMVYFLKIEVNVDCFFFFSRRWRQSQRKLRTKQEPLPPGLRTLGRYVFGVPPAPPVHPGRGAAADQEQGGAASQDHGGEEGKEEDEARGQSSLTVLDLLVSQVLRGEVDVVQSFSGRFRHFRGDFRSRIKFRPGTGVDPDDVRLQLGDK